VIAYCLSTNITPKSLGQSIQSVNNFQEGLDVASQFWLPTDSDLPPHYKQSVHHDTRQRWASQLLQRLSTIPYQRNHPSNNDDFLYDERFCRLVHAAALPHPDDDDNFQSRNNEKRDQWMLGSLLGIHALVGRTYCNEKMQQSAIVPQDTIDGIQIIIEYCCTNHMHYSLERACEIYWAVKGLEARIPALEKLNKMAENDQHNGGPSLAGRISNLPFDIVPLGIDWSDFAENKDQDTIWQDLRTSIPFKKDTIVTRHGKSIIERRGTAWLAAPLIGALAYSGKLMEPQPIPPIVEDVMRSVEKRLDLSTPFFDCALCNHYATMESACKYHTDPEHGTVWHTTTVVVAAGSDRKFSFKPINAEWKNWDVLKVPSPATAATITLFAGDLVVMRDTCNDDFYHAVHAGLTDDERISLVLKRAISRNGQKGHGIEGQGRRNRKNKSKGQNNKSYTR
jgi:hypothetical protein